MDREHKLDVGTIGSAPCQITLNKILVELNDAKVTRTIMRRHNQIREGFKKLEALSGDFGFFVSQARLYYQNHLAKFEKQKDNMPTEAYTYALCCYRVLYRKAIKRDADNG